MSLFRAERRDFFGDPTYNPFERPSMPLASLALDGILGSGQNNDSGQQVDPLRGLGVPTAYRCISIISTVVASCCLEMIDKAGAASDWPDIQNLQSYTPFEILETIVTHLAGWGNFYAFKVTSPGLSTRLLDLQPVFPGNVDVLRQSHATPSLKPLPMGTKFFRVRQKSDMAGTNPAPGSPPDTSSYTDYTEDEIFHIPFLGYDGLKGVSPIMLAAQTFGTAIAADRLAARFHSRGQQLGGIIKVKAPLANQAQADAIKMKWRSSHQGLAGFGDAAVLDAETDFQPVTINPNDLQLIQGREWQANEVARVFGVPLTMLSFDNTGYGDAIETQQVGFVTYTIRSYTDRIEQRFAREFMPRGKCLKFRLDDLMRGSMTERYTAYGNAISWGWMTRAEARKRENMIEIPAKPGTYDLSEPLVPAAMKGMPTDPPLSDPSIPPPTPPTPPTNPDESDSGDDNETEDET